MIHVLLTGTLYNAPVGRIARNGNPFATAKLLADVGDGSAVWCSMIAFAEAGVTFRRNGARGFRRNGATAKDRIRGSNGL